MNDRIERALVALPALVFQDDALGLQSLLEELYDAGADDLRACLRGTEDAADAWNVSTRRAQAHIAAIHERHGVAARIGRAWLITADEIERYRPGESGRPKKAADQRKRRPPSALYGTTLILQRPQRRGRERR